MTLDEASAGTGRKVHYRRIGCMDDEGVIHSTGPRLVFVVYDGTSTPMATDPADLTFADGEVPR